MTMKIHHLNQYIEIHGKNTVSMNIYAGKIILNLKILIANQKMFIINE